MVRSSAEERALARASVYRLLTLAFSYPVRDVRDALPGAMAAAAVAGELLPTLAPAVTRAQAAFEATPEDGLEPGYQHVFTLTYSPDCPPYETAFSAKNLLEQSRELADIAGFYRAFGVDGRGERVDHLASELEFAYLLALKEARARLRQEREHVAVCRRAHRQFLRDHLARWAPLIGQRIALAADDSFVGAAGRLLIAFMREEERFLRLHDVERYRDEPVLIADEPGELTCPYEDGPSEPAELPLLDYVKGGRDALAVR